MRIRIFLLAVTFCLHFFCSKANITASSLFSDHMVLQQGTVVPVWGNGNNGEVVTVSFNGQIVTSTVVNGKWMASLKPLPYINTGVDMTISGANNSIVIKDILVGEVWLCSGQSNMERQLGPRPPQPEITDWQKERDAAQYPAIREYYVPLKYSAEKVADVNSKWKVCSPQTVSDFSAVGYFFARNLHRQLNVPVGIIFSAFGGTPAEDWMSREALTGNPALVQLVKNYGAETGGYKPAGKVMNGLYNGMIYPLLPYAIKGVGWYQGEANNDRPKEYQFLLPTMIKNWRGDFKQSNLPFLIVQIAPFKDMGPEIREAQFLTVSKVKNTALIVTTDCGNANDIHPPHKQPVGLRLSLAARALAYGQKIEYSGPVYQSYTVKDNQVLLKFTHGTGLQTLDNTELKGFTIAGENKQFVPAKALIKNGYIIVYSDVVNKPAAVRYGWANVPEINLCNAAGLPASPFRTDAEPVFTNAGNF